MEKYETKAIKAELAIFSIFTQILAYLDKNQELFNPNPV